MTPQKTLNMAADLIAERGWWNAETAAPIMADNRVCAQLAISEVAVRMSSGLKGPKFSRDSRALYDAAMEELAYRIVGERLKRPFSTGVAWNDSRQSADEVLRVMRGQS